MAQDCSLNWKIKDLLSCSNVVVNHLMTMSEDEGMKMSTVAAGMRMKEEGGMMKMKRSAASAMTKMSTDTTMMTRDSKERSMTEGEGAIRMRTSEGSGMNLKGRGEMMMIELEDRERIGIEPDTEMIMAMTTMGGENSKQKIFLEEMKMLEGELYLLRETRMTGQFLSESTLMD